MDSVTPDGMLARQASLPITVPTKAAVIGCGGVGSWTALFLALAGVNELWLFDFDTVSEHNLNRIPFPKDAIGKRKAQALADLITSLRPDCTVMAMGEFTVDLAQKISLEKEKIKWMVATTDTLASRNVVRKYCRYWGIKYIEASAEGDFGGATGEPAEWATPEDSLPGYASVPVWVGPCVAAAMSACVYVLHDTKPGDTSVRLGWENGEFRAYVHKEEEETPAQEPEEIDIEAVETEDLLEALRQRGYNVDNIFKEEVQVGISLPATVGEPTDVFDASEADWSTDDDK